MVYDKIERKKYLFKNKNKIKKRWKKYRLKNKEKIKEYHKEYHLKNPEKIKRIYKKYYLKNLEKRKKYQREYHLKNGEKRKIYAKEYVFKNPEINLKAQIKYFTKLAKEMNLPLKKYRYALQIFVLTVKKLQGDQCKICGSFDEVTIHHLLYKRFYPALSLNVNNGIPLCKAHHSEIHYKFDKIPPQLTSVLSPEQPIILTGLCTSSNY